VRGRSTVSLLVISLLATPAASASVAYTSAPATLADGTDYGEDTDASCGQPTPGERVPRLPELSLHGLASPAALPSVALVRVPAFLANCAFLL